MKYALVTLVTLALAAFATPASAHIVQATTSVSLADVDIDDPPTLETALRSAVAEVLSGTIAFTPAIVTLTDAKVVDDRLYFRLLIADEDGLRTLEALESARQESSESSGAPLLPGQPSKGRFRL